MGLWWEEQCLSKTLFRETQFCLEMLGSRAGGSMLRSIFAVIGGYLFNVVILTIIFILPQLHSRLSPPQFQVIFNFANLAVMISNGYISAWIAGRAETVHALIFGILMALQPIIVLVSRGANKPFWLQLLLILLIPVSALAGGYIRIWQKCSGQVA